MKRSYFSLRLLTALLSTGLVLSGTAGALELPAEEMHAETSGYEEWPEGLEQESGEMVVQILSETDLQTVQAPAGAETPVQEEASIGEPSGEGALEEAGSFEPASAEEAAPAEVSFENSESVTFSAEESGTEVSGKEAIAEPAEMQDPEAESVDDASKEVGTEELPETESPEESSETASVEETSGKASSEESSGDVSAEESSEDVSAEESSEDVSAEETSEDVSVEETSEDVSAEETSEEESVEETSEEESVEETSEEESVEETSEEETSEEDPEIDGVLAPSISGMKAYSWNRSSVLVTWDPAPGAAGYVIYGKRSGSGPFAYIGYVADPSRHYFLDTKAPDDVYTFYWVFPFVWSYGKRVIGSCPTYVYGIGREQLPAVTGLKADSSVNGVRLFWDSLAGAEGYHIYGRTGSSGAYHFIADVAAASGQVSWLDANASEDTYNFYWVFPYYRNSKGTPVEGKTDRYAYGIKKKRAVIRALSWPELSAIQATYSGQVMGYGAPLSNFNARHYCEYALHMNNQLSPFKARFYGDMNSRTVYLTFPCGWENAPNTSALLDAMAAEGVKGVFYVTYEYASRNQGLIWRMIREGHEIGNHSFAHPANGIPTLPLVEQMNDALRLQEYIQNTFGYTMRKYNFESSYWSEQSVALMTQMGYEVCFYSFNYADWDVSKPMASGQVYNMLMTALAPGCVYYLHPVSVGNVQAIPAFIRSAKSQGYTFGLLP